MRCNFLKTHIGLQERDALLLAGNRSPSFGAALTKNVTHDTARITRLCDSDVQTEELLTTDKQMNVFIYFCQSSRG